MNQLNQIIIEGKVVQAEEKAAPDGNTLLSVRVATSRTYENASGGESREVGFFDCELRGNIGQKARGYCTRGRGVRIVGRLRQSRWKDEDGRSRAKVVIVAERIEFMPFAEKAGEKS